MSKILKLAGASILALALMVGMVVPALAAPSPSSPWVDDFDGQFLTGEVVSIGDQEFVIQSGEEELVIAVDGDTLYYQLSGPELVREWLRQRLHTRQHYQEQLMAQEENGQGNGQGKGQGNGQGFQNRTRAEVASCAQLRLQSQLCQMEGALQTETICGRWLRNFGAEAEFADISAGDKVAVWVVDGTSLAHGVLIIEPAD